jgi:glutamate transport system permease protein
MAVLERLLTVRPSSPGELQLTEALGPKGRRRVLIVTLISVALLIAGLYWIVRRFQTKGQFAPEKWKPFTTWPIWRFLLIGLGNTLKAAAIALFIALVLGIALATWRSQSSKRKRIPSTIFVELFRACALVLLIKFAFFQLPKTPGFKGWSLGTYGFVSLIVGLSLYYSTVFAEVIRSGIRSLPKGQSEAAMAIGLTEPRAMRLVILPQALRRALPNIFTQAASLLKDTSLGVFVTYQELLNQAKIVGEFSENQLQTFFVAGAMYIAVVAALTSTANRIQKRQARAGITPMAPTALLTLPLKAS